MSIFGQVGVHPVENRVWRRLKQEGISMLVIDVGEAQQAVSTFIKDYPIDFGLLLDSNVDISQRWQLRGRGLLSTFIINTGGKLSTVLSVIANRMALGPATKRCAI